MDLSVIQTYITSWFQVQNNTNSETHPLIHGFQTDKTRESQECKENIMQEGETTKFLLGS